MPKTDYFLITSLPSLGDLGSPPPLSLADLRQFIRDNAGPQGPVDAVLLGDDLLQRQGFLAGEIKQVAPAVLSPAQCRDEEPLPEPLAGSEEPSSLAVAADAVWVAYYGHAADLAARRGSAFLAAWVGFDVALRNALAAERAKALGLEADAYLVAAHLAGTEADLDLTVSEWASAADPLSGLRVLDRARWAWLDEHEAWFSFSDEELLAYAARLMLLHRWHRLAEAPAPPADSRQQANQ
jgi:hypothetical protein